MFRIPNANVKQIYSHVVSNPEGYNVISIKFPDNLGLIYDAVSRKISGCPLISGDLEITTILQDKNSSRIEIKSKFIVNPDPKDLWKNIEPPKDGIYYKNNTDRQYIQSNGFKIVAASRRGRSHEHNGSFRDDDFFVNCIGDSKWSILIVADGAGGSKNSRQGSRIAVKSIGEQLTQDMQNGLMNLLDRNIDIWEKDMAKAVENIKEPLNDVFKNASFAAVEKIEEEASKNNYLFKDFSTTVLAAIIKRDLNDTFIATFWVGDGAIAAFGPERKIRLMGSPDAGEFAGQTRFLDKNILNDQEFKKRCSIGKFSKITSIILMTDGVSDPYFETDAGLNDEAKWEKLWSEIDEKLNLDNPAESLLDWLNFFSVGHHDDRTIAVLC